jgi:hypothetical protein
MVYDSTWRGKTRVKRSTRLGGAIGFLLACVLLVGLPTTASATTPAVAGEWELVLKSGTNTFKGTTIVSAEANGKGEFAGGTVHYEDSLTGSFSGTLEGATASVKLTSNALGPFPASEFLSTEMAVESGVGSLALKGKGSFTIGGQTGEGTLVATRIRTYKQIEEQEALEALEREARENVRGEWSLVIKAGSQTSNGTALITTEANTKNEFASSGAAFEGVIPGTFSGTLEISKASASVTVTTEAEGPVPAAKFTSTTMTIESSGGSLSMSGTGTLTSGATTIPGATLTATRAKTYTELIAREAKEKAELEAKEKQEREAKEKVEREAREKAEREAKEKREREAREAAEKAAIAKVTTNSGGNGKTPALTSAQLAGKTFTVGASELLALQITNPNPYAIAGRVTLLVTQSGRARSKKAVSLGTATFGIAASAKQLVKLKLSQKGRLELAHHGTLHVLATVTTKADGQTTTTKTFDLTLHAAKPAHKKH